MSLSDSQKLEALECVSVKGLNIKIVNKSCCPTSVSFKHTAAWSRQVSYLQRIEQPEWWKSACQPAHIYMSAYTISQAFPLRPWFYFMAASRITNGHFGLHFLPAPRRVLGAGLRPIQSSLLSQCVPFDRALCRVSRSRSAAVLFKASQELCRRHPGAFGTWEDTSWWQQVLQSQLGLQHSPHGDT